MKAFLFTVWALLFTPFFLKPLLWENIIPKALAAEPKKELPPPTTLPPLEPPFADLTELLESIERANTLDQEPCRVACYEGQDIFQQCAVDLCGPPHKAPQVIMTNQSFEQNVVPPEILTAFEQNVLPMLVKIQDFKIQKLHSLADSIKQRISHLESPESSQEDWNLALKELAKEHILEELPESLAPETSTVKASGVVGTQHATTRYDLDGRVPPALRPGFQDYIRHLNQNPLEPEPLFCKDSNCQQAILNRLSSTHKDLKRRIEFFFDTDKQEQRLNYCRANFLEHALTRQKIDQFANNLAQYKELIQQKFSEDLSNMSQRALVNYIDKHVTINLPKYSSNLEKDFTDHIEEERTKIEQAQANNNNIGDIRDAFSFVYTTDICVSNFHIGITDRIVNGQEIDLSSFSCTFHDHGTQILAHEMGHAMNHFFADNMPTSTHASSAHHARSHAPSTAKKISQQSSAWYRDLRSCAAKRYKQADPTHTPQKNDTLKTEEDMADLLTYKVFQDESKIFACSVLEPNLDNLEYFDLDIAPKDWRAEKSHSTPFLRIIIEAIHKGKTLSPACRQVVSQHQDQIDFNPCF